MARKTPVELRAENYFGAFDDIARLSKPIIAAVSGYALGGGCELALLCDIIIAAESAQFGQPEIKLGIQPGIGGSQRLTRAVGKSLAMELILTGRTFDAAEAARLGLINRVVPDSDLLGEAIKLAQELATKPPLTLTAALAAIHRGMDASIDDGLAIEEAAFARIVPTHDAGEGVAAFLEKRRPTFLGR